MGRVPRAISICYQIEKGKTNVVADALSRRHTLLSSLGARILGFDNIRELYVFDEYFSPIYASCGHKAQDGFYIAKGCFFKEGRLCIPQGSIRKLLAKESHEGWLMGHFGIDKTLVLLKEKFFWPHIKKMSIGIALGVWLVYKPSLG